MELAKIVVYDTTGACIMRKRIPAGIVGATVSVEFKDPIWDRMSKTVTFRGSDTVIAEFDGRNAVIPWEVVQTPGQRVFFGIWGSDPESDLQLPLIEVVIGITEIATDPNADPGTDPTLPIWAQLREEVDQLKEAGTGGSDVPGKPGEDGEDGGYYTPSVSQPDQETVQFDFTPSDPDMPAVAPATVKLPKPDSGGISVTGAKVGQTVKIAEVDENGVPTVWEAVEFPGDKEYELIETIVCDGTFGSISRTNLSLKRAKLYINTKAGTEATAVNIRGYNDSGLFSNAYISSGVHTTDRFYSVVFVSDGKDAYVENTGSSAASYSASGLYRTAYRQNADTPIKTIDMNVSSGVLPEGSIIEIWGVRA